MKYNQHVRVTQPPDSEFLQSTTVHEIKRKLIATGAVGTLCMKENSAAKWQRIGVLHRNRGTKLKKTETR